jgi:hypothetical protein
LFAERYVAELFVVQVIVPQRCLAKLSSRFFGMGRGPVLARQRHVVRSLGLEVRKTPCIVESRLTLLTWMVGFNLKMTAALVTKAFV